MSKKLNIGLIGFGCVGSGLYAVLNESNLLDASISKIVVKDPSKKRSLDQRNFSYDVNDILEDDSINVVIELINDSTEAFVIVKKALSKGKDVVTANKKLLAEHLDELISLGKSNNASLLYEGAVGGSIPIIRNLEEYYNNDSLTSVEGIVNGTTNYILTKSNSGVTYDEALKDAQNLGFAELNPTLDVDGFDSKYKLVLLLKHAFGISVAPKEITNVGIKNISTHEVRYAKEKGLRIKLFSRAEKLGNSIVGLVAPHFIKDDHFAFNVNNEFNAVVVEAAFSDKQLFIGKGAGSFPTASAVLSDLSALKFDYQYEYRKAQEENTYEFSNDFFLRVYLGSPYIEVINEVPFYYIDELFQSEQYVYQTGWVRFSELEAFNFNYRKEMSFVILPDAFVTAEDFFKNKANNRTEVVETAINQFN